MAVLGMAVLFLVVFPWGLYAVASGVKNAIEQQPRRLGVAKPVKARAVPMVWSPAKG